jgi:tetratricopeptide (TPR) repeat protein
MKKVDALTVDLVFKSVLSAGTRLPANALPRRLTPLFRELQASELLSDPDETSELIWALWISHRDERAASDMLAAIEAMSQGARDLARPIFDRLVSEHPDWAEAWNKRATLAFVEKRDEDAMHDIERALELEPRHFGAILGFAQICLRQNFIAEAKAAFEVARSIHPHIAGLSEIISDLEVVRRSLH